MYGLTVKQILKRLKISAIFGIICEVIMLCLVFYAITQEGLKADFVSVLATVLFSGLLFTWEAMCFILNWKKILKGILLPVPFISMIIETFKGYIMAIKAIVFALKNKDTK